jgi:hypothetical protein
MVLVLLQLMLPILLPLLHRRVLLLIRRWCSQ